MQKVKYYAVKVGRIPGVYNTWEECQEQVKTFNGAEYKSFVNLEEAKEYIDPNYIQNDLNNVKGLWQAYVDGSYNPKTTEYSFGGILFNDKDEYTFKQKFTDCPYAEHRNVAGEIRAASFIINYCIKNNIKELALFYDYEGIEKWYTGVWRAKKPMTMKYVEFAKIAKKKIKVKFIKVKSHSNNKYNDIADALAKEALGIE